MDYTLPGSSVQISQAGILEWVAISFSRISSWPRGQTWVSCIAGRVFTTAPPGKPMISTWKWKWSRSVESPLCNPMNYIVHGILQALAWVAIGVGSHSLFQGIFPTQGSNPGLLHCRWILYQLSHQGNLRILEWAAYPFSSGSSWPRNWTRVSCIAGRFFTNWAMRETQCGNNNVNTYFMGLLEDDGMSRVWKYFRKDKLVITVVTASGGDKPSPSMLPVVCVQGWFLTVTCHTSKTWWVSVKWPLCTCSQWPLNDDKNRTSSLSVALDRHAFQCFPKQFTAVL